MAQNIRLNDTLDLARRHGKVATQSLSDTFGVTVQIARRNLSQLCGAGQLTRVHGGGVLHSGTRISGKQTARRRTPRPKQRSRALVDHRNLMVVTNKLHVGHIFASAPGVDVILAGGLLRSADGALVGEVTAEFVRQFRPDVALLGAAALSPDGDALDFDFREVRVAQAVMALARRSYLLADTSKFTRSAAVRIGRIADFDGFETDKPPPPVVQQDCGSS